MTLREHFHASGAWLFRHRGVLPTLLLPLFLVALVDVGSPAGDRPRDPLWDGLCLAVALVGLGLRIVTIGFAAPGTSGRNRGVQVANSLNTTGMYGLVRHPLYLANYLMWLGVALVLRVWWLPVIVTLVFWLYYERIMFAEEEFLQREFGTAFSQWAADTPAFLPSRLRWRRTDRPFSWRTARARQARPAGPPKRCFVPPVSAATRRRNPRRGHGRRVRRARYGSQRCVARADPDSWGISLWEG